MNKSYTAAICLAKAIITKDPEILSVGNKLTASLTHTEIEEVWERLAPILSETEVEWYRRSLLTAL